MAGRSVGSDVLHQLDTLFRVGVVGDLSDGQLVQRFLNAREGADQAAFTALVERHGPMVLRVCRQVLGDSHDVQDAFQATFLVLARKAGSVRKADSVASWLYGVAHRVAVRAKADAARRRAHERRGAVMAAESLGGAGQAESCSVLHEEIARLPERYREPVVLCYLEGLTTEAAAQRLGWPRGTVLSRLSRARERLRGRLTRRGLAPSAGLVPAGLSTKAATASVPHLLVDSTAKAAMWVAAGKVSAGAVPASIVALTEKALKAMMLIELKSVAAGLLGLGVMATGVGVIALGGRGVAEAPATPATRGDQENPRDKAKVDDGPLQRDIKALSGRWTVTRFEHRGKAAPEDEARADFTVEPGGKAVLAPEKKKGRFNLSYIIDPTRTPKTIDLTYEDEKAKGMKQYGIYKLDGGQLTLCLGHPGASVQKRPEEFTTEGKDDVLMVFERNK